MSETMQATMSDDLRAQILVAVRSSRLGRPADIAGMVAFLLSEDGDWINGQVLHVNGGSSFHE